jgi:AcrR family transcriptional regulator
MAKSGIGARRSAALEEGGPAYVARREEIIKAAAHVFRDRGVEAATLRDVAEATDTDRATLYYYVGSKEELLQEIVRQALSQDIATAYSVKRSRASTKDKIAALIEAMVKGYQGPTRRNTAQGPSSRTMRDGALRHGQLDAPVVSPEHQVEPRGSRQDVHRDIPGRLREQIAHPAPARHEGCQRRC